MQRHRLVQVEAEDRHLLHQHQAAKAEDEHVLRHFVAPPQHTGSEAGGLGLVFMQEKQWLRWGNGSSPVLGGGDGLIARTRRILQEREETPAEPAQEPQHHQSRQVLEGGGGGAAGRDGEEENEGTREGARPTPGGVQELPVRQPVAAMSSDHSEKVGGGGRASPPPPTFTLTDFLQNRRP